MNWLFRESNKQITGKTARFVSPDDHQVTISIHSPDNNTYEIKLQSQNMALLYQTDANIKNKLKVCLSYFVQQV